MSEDGDKLGDNEDHQEPRSEVEVYWFRFPYKL